MIKLITKVEDTKETEDKIKKFIISELDKGNDNFVDLFDKILKEFSLSTTDLGSERAEYNLYELLNILNDDHDYRYINEVELDKLIYNTKLKYYEDKL